MKKTYRKLLNEGKLGALAELIDIKTHKIKDVTETERLRIFVSFISDNLKEDSLTAGELVRNLSVIEKSLAGEINGNFLIKEKDGNRFQSFGSESHYQVILLHTLEKMGMEYSEDLILNKDKLKELSKIIWH